MAVLVLLHCYLHAVERKCCECIMKLPEQTALSDVSYLPSEGTVALLGTERMQTGGGRVQICIFQVGPTESDLLFKSGWLN